MASLLTAVGETVSKEIQALTKGRSLSSPPERGRAGGNDDEAPPKEQQHQHPHEIAPPLKPGDHAPQSEAIPFPSKKPVIIVFLRHCGCPFAEKTFRLLTAFSNHNKESIHCVAVTQASSQEATDEWVIANGGEWDVEVLTDSSRELYARWGLGLASSWWKVFGPVQLAEAYKLGVHEGIWGTGGVSPFLAGSGSGSGSPDGGKAVPRSLSSTGPAGSTRPRVRSSEEGDTCKNEGATNGGDKWQMGGVFAVDEEGIVRWAHVETSASGVPDLKQAKQALEEARRKKKERELAAKSDWDSWNEVEQRFVP